LNTNLDITNERWDCKIGTVGVEGTVRRGRANEEDEGEGI
jgi:hypothetical protein